MLVEANVPLSFKPQVEMQKETLFLNLYHLKSNILSAIVQVLFI